MIIEPDDYNTEECFTIGAPFMLSKLAAQVEQFERQEISARFSSSSLPAMGLNSYRAENGGLLMRAAAQSYSVPTVHLHIPKLNLNATPQRKMAKESTLVTIPENTRMARAVRPARASSRAEVVPLSHRRYSPKEVAAAPAPVLIRKKKERRARKKDPLAHIDWLNISPRTKLLQAVKNDLPTLFDYVRTRRDSVHLVSSSNSSLSFAVAPTSDRPSVVLVSPRSVSAASPLLLVTASAH